MTFECIQWWIFEALMLEAFLLRKKYRSHNKKGAERSRVVCKISPISRYPVVYPTTIIDCALYRID